MTLAVVTGGESGIGAACALRMAQAGADVAITYFRDAAAADEVVAKVMTQGRKGLAVRCDVADEGQVAALFDAINSGNGEVFVPRYAPPLRNALFLFG